MLLDYIRQIHATQNFSLGDSFEVLEFDDVSKGASDDDSPDTVEIWAAVKVPYTGDVPESYKVLNLTIGDWVAKNVDGLTKAIHSGLDTYLRKNYPNAEITGLDSDDEDSAVWLDQLDYMPRIDEDGKFMIVEIDLVLDAEPVEEPEEGDEPAEVLAAKKIAKKLMKQGD